MNRSLALNNNLKSAFKPSLAGSLNVVFNAGTRFEDNQGVANVLKNFAFRNTAERSSLRQVREAEAAGGVLYSTLTRDNLILSTDFLPQHQELFVQILADVVKSTKFTQHEYDEAVKPALQAEFNAAQQNALIQAIDTAHTIAFRRGLGNSLFSASEHPVKLEDVKAYASKVYSADNVAFLSTGPSDISSSLSKYFSGLSSTGQAQTQKSQYFGGEQRLNLPHEGHALPSAFISWGSNSSSPAHTVLAELLGSGSNIKWNKGLSPLAAIEEADVKAVNFEYSDASLFGFAVQSSSESNVKKASQKAVEAFKKIAQNGVESTQLQAAIAKSKFNYTLYADSADGWKQINGNGLINNNLKSLDQVLGEFDAVSTSSIQQAAADLLKNKVTLVTVGGRELPYADELGL
ncbi:LuxS/MPP-like metallohydrolase [Wallemia mellicola]|nr:LuxS/MPP-like metallohydrolase [Wallemia mellicola]TIC29012.1 LuxS/MPP-like metallohydrolase [Wallemia mellicola]TIC74167.1 LuxS/MPP-like metallohydrolase [Wallemia mellicola]